MNGDGPKTLSDWIQYLHAAAQAKQADPSDAEAQAAIDFALQRIQRLQTVAGVADQPAELGAVGSTAASLAHGASLGTGELFAGLGSAAQGRGFREGAQGYRASLDEIEAAHPNLAAGGQIVGSVALPAGQIGQTVGRGVRAGVPLGIRGALSLVGRGAASGAVPGAVQGFATGGEDPGDLGARVRGAATGAAVGGAIGGAATGLAIPLVRRQVERSATIADAGQRRANEVMRGRLLERRLRQTMPPQASQRVGSTLDDISQAQQDFAAGRISEEDFNTAMEFAGATPTFQRRAAGQPRASETAVLQRALEREQPRPGHPVYAAGRAPTRSAEVRGGERLTPSAPAPPRTGTARGAPAGQVGIAQQQIKALQEALDAGRIQLEDVDALIADPAIREAVKGALVVPPARGSLP